MKKNLLSVLSILLIMISFNVFFSSCKKDPVKPEDEVRHKDHEDPQRAELLFVEGHLHGKYGFHQNPDYKKELVKHMKRVQKITYELTPKGWAPAKGSADKFLTRGTPRESRVYGLWIKYYNAKGEEMTGQFIQNGQDKIHQHFFIPREVKPSLYGKDEENDNDPSAIFDYLYCDSDPWNKSYSKEGAKLIGDKNPLGFKGYFKFKKANKAFTLDIRLLHAASSKFDKDGKASPFYKPSSAQLQNDQWDLSMKIPVIIFNDAYEYIEDPERYKGKSEKEIPERDMKLLREAAAAYGITWQEALNDYIGMENSDTDPESGNLWF